MSNTKTTVYVQHGDLLPEWNRNVPYWTNLDNVENSPDGLLHYDQYDGYFDQNTGVELDPEEFAN